MVFLLSVVVIGALWFQPHVKALVFGQQTRPVALDNFVQQVRTEQDIDEKAFWEFRERYTPGSFTFSSSVTFLGTQVIQQLPAANESLHTFTSEHLVSQDFVIPRDPGLEPVDQVKAFLASQISIPMSEESILFSNESNLIYQTDDGQTIIFFFRPIEELYTVDGLFDFTEDERELLKDRFWVSLTVIE